MRKAAWLFAILLLGVTGVFGFVGVRDELNGAQTPLQMSVAFAVALYSVTGVLGAVGLWRRRPWSVTITATWAIATMWAGTVASFAFNDPTFSKGDTLTGTIAAFISLALVGFFVIWAARSAARVPPSTESGHIPSS